MADLGGTKSRRRFIRPCVVAGLIALAGFLTLGLPGAIVLQAAVAVAHLFTKNALGADQVWPAAIGISLVGPFVMVPVYLAMADRVKPRWLGMLGTIAVTLLVTILASAAGILLAVS